MNTFEILCVTMNQSDFSKIEKMNIKSDVIFANQSDENSMKEISFNGHTARMVTTATRGVGINRNLTLIYAQADICMFADDDVVYVDDMESKVLEEFEAHPDADIIIFHFETDDFQRKQKSYKYTRKCSRWERMPWAGFRVAFRLNSIKKANIWFSTLFGGGCLFPSGEDSKWLIDAKRAGLTMYVSNKTIGSVSFKTSTWFTGMDERFFFGKGAFYQELHSKTFILWKYYFALRTHNMGQLSFRQKCKWINNGCQGYKNMQSYENFKKITAIK